MQIVQNCRIGLVGMSKKVKRRDKNWQATLPISWRAKDCICCRGKGANSLSLRKSNTHIPSSSDTKHIWFRWSNQCNKWMHLLNNCQLKNNIRNGLNDTDCRFIGSRSLSFCSTRTSILLASRYFGIARMILMATLVLFVVSTASTTFPNVPWPNRRTVRSNYRCELSNGHQCNCIHTASCD